MEMYFIINLQIFPKKISSKRKISHFVTILKTSESSEDWEFLLKREIHQLNCWIFTYDKIKNRESKYLLKRDFFKNISNIFLGQ